MLRIFRQFAIGLVLVVLVAPATLAAGFQEGLAAYKRGNYAAALEIMRPLAIKGDASAQNDLAVMYRKGHGVRRDNAAAAAWFLLAARQGYARAQNNLAVMFRRGEGVPRDYGKAAAWSRRAAEQGHARAQNNLAVMYLKGQGVPQDDAAALTWFRRAAEQGYPRAQNNLRFMLEEGRGIVAAEPPPPKSQAKIEPKPAPKPAPEIATKTVPAPTPVPVLAPMPTPATALAPTPVRGTYGVQLGAVKSKVTALKEAGRLNRAHEGLLGGHKIVPVHADLGKRGIFYRLRAGPLGDRAAATALCRKLSARKQGCMVVKP